MSISFHIQLRSMCVACDAQLEIYFIYFDALEEINKHFCRLFICCPFDNGNPWKNTHLLNLSITLSLLQTQHEKREISTILKKRFCVSFLVFIRSYMDFEMGEKDNTWNIFRKQATEPKLTLLDISFGRERARKVVEGLMLSSTCNDKRKTNQLECDNWEHIIWNKIYPKGTIFSVLWLRQFFFYFYTETLHPLCAQRSPIKPIEKCFI